MLFGIRGSTENHKLRWSDIELRSDENGRDLEFNDRETKTRTGENSTHQRAFWPKQFTNPDDPSNCPVTAFKIFRDRRPPATKPQKVLSTLQSITKELLTQKPLGENSLRSIIESDDSD